MDDIDSVNNIAKEVSEFERRVNNINIEADLTEVQVRIKETENDYNDLSKKIDECESDLSQDTNTGSLINKLNQHREDLEIARKKLIKKKEAWSSKHSFELLQLGKLKGEERIKAQRDVIMEQHKEIDYQGDIINGIGSNVKEANQNLVNINKELKSQAQIIDNVHEKTDNMSNTADKTDEVMSKIEKRAYKLKIAGIIAIIVLGLAYIVILIVKLVKKFK